MSYLKIKDNIDLDSLAKYGIINKGMDRCYYYAEKGFISLLIDKYNRIIKVMGSNGIIKLFDLIQAGVVEKVEENGTI